MEQGIVVVERTEAPGRKTPSTPRTQTCDKTIHGTSSATDSDDGAPIRVTPSVTNIVVSRVTRGVGMDAVMDDRSRASFEGWRNNETGTGSGSEGREEMWGREFGN